MSAIPETAITTPIPDLEAEHLLGSFPDGPGLVGTRCGSCGNTMLGARTVCSSCVGLDVEPACLSRTGELYTFTRLYLKETVRTIGYVDLAEGVRTLADVRSDGQDLVPGLQVALGVDGDQWFFAPAIEEERQR